ncbi:MAG: rane bound O-acyl transferase family protein [Myxococcaceae bacterium]|nr:rane bound O-acyl transferase family protein [Myxococcaceae bacterium]
MVFNSVTFLVFFALVLLLYRVLPSWTAKKAMLLAASYVFYGAWNPPFALLLFLTTLLDYWLAGRMWKCEQPRTRRAYLLVSLVANLGVLSYFKYGGFLLNNFVAVLHAVGVEFQPAPMDILLPVGISFYTFETLSYTIDVYRKQLKPAPSFLDFAMFVSFFPHLVAGPIVRAADFLYQLEQDKRIEAKNLGWGLFMMTLGLFEKMVLADSMLAASADTVFNNPGPTSQLDSWLGTIAFAGQIFCDFAGYTTCAIGAALCFGFHLIDNFRFPYAAIGLRDFWRRWHISLSTWLRDYLYIPLGGNRSGPRRMQLALLTTMVLGGLWHGASWNFAIWGTLHGLFLVAERKLTRRFGGAAWTQKAPVRFAFGALTFALVCIAWVFFRAKDLPQSAMVLASMMGAIPATPVLSTANVVQVVAVTACLIGSHVALRDRRLEDVARVLPAPVLTLLWSIMLFAIVLTQGGGDAFIYFQF